MRTGSERGLTAVELIIVVGIIAIVSTLAVPGITRALAQAEVVSIVADFRAVRSAANEYYRDNNRWPAETEDFGEIPPELAGRLQDQVDWSDYNWENWIGQDGTPTHPESGIAIGFSVRPEDSLVRQLLKDSWDGPLEQGPWGEGLTFVIEPFDRSGSSQ